MTGLRPSFSKQVTESGLAELACDVASLLVPGDILFLSGDMGTGKTAFVSYLAKALGSPSTVSSPTFTLIQKYEAKLPIIHMDLYRLETPSALEDLAFSELIEKNKGGIVCIEWPQWVDQLYNSLATVRLSLTYVAHKPELRQIEITF